jgi:hypothetical protein
MNELSVKQGNPFCYWYSKVAIIVNMISIIAFIVWRIQIEPSDPGRLVIFYFYTYLTTIFTVGFWRYSLTNDEWPFAFSAIFTTIISIISALLLIDHLFDGMIASIIITILIFRSGLEIYAYKLTAKAC